MARIEIKDLPATEKLTPEQEELIRGAGLNSFRPTVEELGDRQLLDAGFGAALIGSAIPLSAPVYEMDTIHLAERPGHSETTPQSTTDGDTVQKWVVDKFSAEVIGAGRVNNRFSLHGIVSSSWKQTGNVYTVTLNVEWGLFGTRPAIIEVDIADGGIVGASHRYACTAVRCSTQSMPNVDQLQEQVKPVYANGIQLYDPEQLTDAITQRLKDLHFPECGPNYHNWRISYQEMNGFLRVIVQPSGWYVNGWDGSCDIRMDFVWNGTTDGNAHLSMSKMDVVYPADSEKAGQPYTMPDNWAGKLASALHTFDLPASAEPKR